MSESDGSVKVDFTKASDLSNEAKQDFWESLRKRGLDNSERIHKSSVLRERELQSNELQVLGRYIESCRNALVSLGIDNPKDLLPTASQITVIDSDEAMVCGGDVEIPVEEMRTIVPTGRNLDDISVEQVMYHEVSHFVTKVVVDLKSKTLVDQSEMSEEQRLFLEKLPQFDVLLKKTLESAIPGYDSSMFDRTTESKITARGFSRASGGYEAGVFEEGAADLFALYVFSNEGKDVQFQGGYAAETIFVMEFLEKYAELANISSVDALGDLLRSKIRRDFGFYKRVVKAFSSLPVLPETEDFEAVDGKKRAIEMCKAINRVTLENHVLTNEGWEILKYGASMGGFYESFMDKGNTASQGKAVAFSGLKGGIYY